MLENTTLKTFLRCSLCVSQVIAEQHSWSEVPGSECGISNWWTLCTRKFLPDVVLMELMVAVAREKPGQCGTKPEWHLRKCGLDWR